MKFELDKFERFLKTLRDKNLSVVNKAQQYKEKYGIKSYIEWHAFPEMESNYKICIIDQYLKDIEYIKENDTFDPEYIYKDIIRSLNYISLPSNSTSHSARYTNQWEADLYHTFLMFMSGQYI